MKLDRTTYEAWLLDRIEGKLSSAQERELDLFLAANPDLHTASGELPFVGDDTLPFDMKAELKKTFPPAGEPDILRLNDFLAARLEGDLDRSQEQALDKFLFEHPEHAQDAKRMAASKVVRDRKAFHGKATIGRQFPPQGFPDKHRLTDFLVAAEEGDLSPEQSAALRSYIQTRPEAQREQRLVASARVARERVVFFGKEQLKKRESRVIMMWPRYAAAASIALLIGLAWWMMREQPAVQQELAKQEVVKEQAAPQPGAQAGSLAPDRPEESSGEQEDRERSDGPKGLPVDEQKRARPAAPIHDAPLEPVQPAPQQVIPYEHDQPEPQLAQQTEPATQPVGAPLAQQPVTQRTQTEPLQPVALAAPEAASHEGGTTIGALLANTVREKVLATDERTTGLDQDDALAMLDKGVQAITGGTGGVHVERSGARDRVKLRLGRNLAITASRGR